MYIGVSVIIFSVILSLDHTVDRNYNYKNTNET